MRPRLRLVRNQSQIVSLVIWQRLKFIMISLLFPRPTKVCLVYSLLRKKDIFIIRSSEEKASSSSIGAREHSERG